MKMLDKEIKEFNDYLNEQMNILKGHHERITLRILNKFSEITFRNNKLK